VADYCLAALVRQEQRKAEADEHEPVPHREVGGAEDAADRDLVFWKTSNRIFRLGLTDPDPVVSTLVTV
jgi:hypothetical protein